MSSNTTTSTSTIPTTSRALIYKAAGEPLSVESVPTPSAGPGSVIVRVLACSIPTAANAIFSGKIPYMNFPTPLTPGNTCVGRIAATGRDATVLEVGQLVFVDCVIRGRDDPDVQILMGLSGGFGARAARLMGDVWRDGVWAEYARVPLENCYAMDERALLASPASRYSLADLAYIPRQLVPYGGLRGIGLKAGETVIVAPATGAFSGAAVEVASAMGARVIAASRNMAVLERIKAHVPRTEVVKFTGDVDADTKALQQFGPVDAFLDISPHRITSTNHIKSCLAALRPRGRASLMGGLTDDIPVNYFALMSKNITVQGRFMYERDDIRTLIRMVEMGVLKLDKSAGLEVLGEYKLEDWQAGFTAAERFSEWGKQVVFKP